MRLSTDLKRAWLGLIYRRSQPDSTLLTELTTESDTRATAILSGQLIASSSANGHAVGFSMLGEAALSPVDMATLSSEMLRRYDAAKAALIAAGTAAPADAQIYAQMLAELVPVRSYLSDFSRLRA